VASVLPPQRPGAVLWSRVAGPLVNVFLVPVTATLWLLAFALGWPVAYPDLYLFLRTTFVLNAGLLILNLLPVYPLDGGQILQALLWFVIGRAQSLMVVCLIGMVVAGGMFFLSLLVGDWMLAAMTGFGAMISLAGFQHARLLARLLSGPRREDAACPTCGVAPLIGKLWVCDQCGARFDTFATRARCPNCYQLFGETRCPDCYQKHPIAQWFAHAPPHAETDPHASYRGV
jgi:hypothetical protein